MKKKQKQEREGLETRLKNDEQNIGVLSTERRSSRNSSNQQESEEEKQRHMEFSAKCKTKAEEIKSAKSDDDKSTSCTEPKDGDDYEDEIVFMNDGTL